MPDFHGPIQHVTIAGTLGLILAFPLLAALFCAWRAIARPRLGDRARRAIAVASIGAISLALAMSAYHAAILATKGEGERYLLQHLWRMVRVGQLDASFDLALDPLASTMTLVVTAIGLPIVIFASAYMKGDAAYARFFAWLNGFVVAMLLLVLADNFVLLFFGWEGVGLCSWGLIGFWWQDAPKATAGRKAFVVNRIGDTGLVLGVALLYWGLGGTWADGDYVPDLNARFSTVEVREAHDEDDAAHAAPAARPEPDEDEDDALAATPSTSGGGLLTLTSYSGAVVFMDDARTPLLRARGEPLRSPFARVPVKGGFHSFRIHPGGGLDDFLVTHVAFGAGREIALASFGPTVTFRDMRDQLVARDVTGHAPFRDALLAKKGWGSTALVTLACLLLFAGAVAKSAQFPLYVWLPDAMAGPTPVSALIHAATMVTAGVYLIARMSFLFVLSPAACTVVAVVGAGTALFAATMGLYQYDLKRILAYSTVSQLGFMVLGAGVGGYAASVFHLVTHACFKALLFLAAGAVIHRLHADEPDEARAQDIRRMGGLKRALPKTAQAYFIGCLAITAAPIPGLAGFWSKDDILVRAFTAQNVRLPGPLLGLVGLAAAGLTSFYMWRSWYLAFEGEPATSLRDEAHEAPRRMTGVLAVLAALSAVVGLVFGVSARLFGGDGETILEEWLAPSLRDAAAPFTRGGALVEWGVIAGSYAVALGGWAIARARYARRAPGLAWEDRERTSPLFAASTHGWWLDAIYALTVVPLVSAAAEFLAELDRRVIDGVVNGVAVLTRATSWVVGHADDEVVDGAVRAVSEGTLRAGQRVRELQSGRVQTYVYSIVLGVLALASLQYWLR